MKKVILLILLPTVIVAAYLFKPSSQSVEDAVRNVYLPGPSATPSNASSTVPVDTSPKIIIAENFDVKDNFDLNKVWLEGSTLHLSVSYGGVCGEHTFALYIYTYGFILESYPPQMDIVLVHDSQGDICKAYITEDLKFDISPITEIYKGDSGDLLILRVRGYKKGDVIRVEYRL